MSALQKVEKIKMKVEGVTATREGEACYHEGGVAKMATHFLSVPL